MNWLELVKLIISVLAFFLQQLEGNDEAKAATTIVRNTIKNLSDELENKA